MMKPNSSEIQKITEKLMPILDELSELGPKFESDFGLGTIKLEFREKASIYNEMTEEEKEIYYP